METKMGKAETDKAETDKAEMVLFVVRIKNKSQECVSVWVDIIEYQLDA